MVCYRLKNRFIATLLAVYVLADGALLLDADDNEARSELKEAAEEYAAANYYDAAKAYKSAVLYAESVDIKFDALQKAADSFGKAGKKYKQFQCIDELIVGFPDRINFAHLVEQEYKIGNEFSKGHRDVPLSWLPWIKGENKADEIYETVLKHAPFAKFAPELKLRLGRLYLEKEENKKALAAFRGLIAKYPKTREAKYARFELANALVQLADKAGDGDEAYAREAEDVLKETLKLYPKDSETLWIKDSMRETDAIRAERLYKLAAFYQSRKNPEAAIRYYKDLVARFPDNDYARKAEKEIAELDDTYKSKLSEKSAGNRNHYPILEMKDERGVVLVAPEESGGKWLLPVEDLDPDSLHADAEYKTEQDAIAEAKRREAARRAAELKARQEARKKLEAERKARKKAEDELRKKKEAERLARLKAEADEKAALIKAKAETAAKAKADAERKKQAEAAAKAKKATEKTSAEADKKGSSSGKVTDDLSGKIKSTGNQQKVEENNTTYILLLILIVLAVLAALIWFLKKKKNKKV